jgi:photosystem II stability/assembly factor-like uncharacterized protein
MPDKVRLLAVTGDAVARLRLDGDVELALSGSGAQCVAVDPNDPRRAYVGTFDDGVHLTDDGGATWRPADDGPADDRVLALAVSPSHRENGVSVAYAGTEPSNLYRSEDGGRRWQLVPALRKLPSKPHWSFPGRPWTHHVRTIALHPTDPGWLLVGIELGGVMRSVDAGASWTDHNAQAHRDAHQLITHSRAPDRVYEAAGQGVALSEDRAASWTRLGAGLDRTYAWATAADLADPDLWYVAVSRGPFAAHGGGDGQARLVRRENGDWRAVDDWGDEPALHRMPYALAALPGRPRALLAGLRGGTLLLTTDAGESWRRLPFQLPDVIDLAVAPA